jgi:hypothetical protein
MASRVLVKREDAIDNRSAFHALAMAPFMASNILPRAHENALHAHVLQPAAALDSLPPWPDTFPIRLILPFIRTALNDLGKRRGAAHIDDVSAPAPVNSRTRLSQSGVVFVVDAV